MNHDLSGAPDAGLDPAGRRRLGELFLELAGRSAGRMLTAKRHVEILTSADPLLDNHSRIIARRRIRALEDKWGPLGSPGPVAAAEASPAISPELRAARWLSKRRNWYNLLRVLHRAAGYFVAGGTRLSDAEDHAYGMETDGTLRDVGLSSFTEWMVELRIAKRVSRGIYVPGELCEWWVSEMSPTRSGRTAYATCMDLATELCWRKLPHNR